MPQSNPHTALRHEGESSIPRAELPNEGIHEFQREQVYEDEVIVPQDSLQYAQAQVPVVKTLLSWTAPGRPFRKRGKEYFVNIIILTLAIEVILFLFGQWMLMVLVAALVFLTFALATIPPQPFHYKISTQGITIEDHYYLWQEIYDFYFKHVDATDTLVLRTKAYMPGELVITLGELHREQIKHALLPYLPFREFMKPSFLERSSEWLGKTFPLEKQTVHMSSQPQ